MSVSQALAWMVNALICSGQLSLPAWEPYVQSSAEKAQSFERRWRRFLDNERICVQQLYLPLVVAEKEGMATAPTISCPGYHHVVESLLHDSSVSGLLWASHPVTMASVGTWQCNGSVQGVQAIVTQSSLVVTSSPRCDVAR